MASRKQVVMAKQIARRWIRRVAYAEYRFQVLFGSREIKNLPGLLRSFRDGKIAMANVPTIGDLGIHESFDSVSLWSRDRESLIQLKNWFEKRGFETTGVW